MLARADRPCRRLPSLAPMRMMAAGLKDEMATERSIADPDELIGLIYRGPLEATPWQQFLGKLEERMGCLSAGMVLRLSGRGRPPLLVWGHRPALASGDADEARMAHAKLGHLDPLRNALTKPGDIHTLDEIMPRDTLHENEFYRRVLQPYGVEYALGMYISEPGGWECNVGLVNDEGRGDFDERDKMMLARLRPHLEQALTLYSRIQRDGSELHALADTLDRLTISTIILAGTGRIVRMNGAAHRLAERGDLIVTDQKIVIPDRTENSAFQTLVAQAIDAWRTGEAGRFAEGMKIRSAADEHLGLLVRGIDSPTPFVSDASPAVILHFAGDTSERPIERLVTKIFDLTPAEAQLATLLAMGYSLAQAADRLDLKESTVRTYCKAILGKVGVGRQADLVRLILRSVAVLG